MLTWLTTKTKPWSYEKLRRQGVGKPRKSSSKLQDRSWLKKEAGKFKGTTWPQNSKSWPKAILAGAERRKQYHNTPSAVKLHWVENMTTQNWLITRAWKEEQIIKWGETKLVYIPVRIPVWCMATVRTLRLKNITKGRRHLILKPPEIEGNSVSN